MSALPAEPALPVEQAEQPVVQLRKTWKQCYYLNLQVLLSLVFFQPDLVLNQLPVRFLQLSARKPELLPYFEPIHLLTGALQFPQQEQELSFGPVELYLVFFPLAF